MDKQVVYLSPHDLVPYERNAKIHPQRQIDNIINSISRFGWQQPIVVDKDMVVIIGHGRLMAALQMELDEVPVLIADNLTEEETRELRIVDNKTNESEWDWETLKKDVEGLSFEGFDFGLDDIRIVKDEPEQADEDEKVVCPRCGHVFEELAL